MKNERQYRQKSIPFKFRISFKKNDFIIGDSNKDALTTIERIFDIKEKGLIIIGPNSSGKTHLISVLNSNKDFKVIEGNDINKEKISLKNVKKLVIENIEKIHNYEFFLHIINLSNEKNFFIVMTSNKDIKKLEITLKDLKSRLLTFTQTNIHLPTDDILYGLIAKLSKDFGVNLNKATSKFIIHHSERSYESINKLMFELNKVSLDRKKNITIPLVKEILKTL